MKKSFKFFNCVTCKTQFMSDASAPEKECDKCRGIAPAKVDGVPNLGTKDRLGDNPFPKASQEWRDFLRKVKKENPGSTIDVK